MDSNPLKLADLIRLSGTGPVTWLAGDQPEELAVSWIAASPEEVMPGDLLLLPADDFSQEVAAQAQRRGAAGILLAGKASIPAGADLDYLVVATIPAAEDGLRELQRRLLTGLIDQRAAMMERGARIHAQLAQKEAEGWGLLGLAQAISEISGRGVLIQDKRGRILAEHPAPALLAAWEDILGDLGTLDSLPEVYLDRKLAVEQAASIVQPIPEGLERIIAPIIVGRIARGYLSLVGPSGEMDELDQLVIQQAGLVCAVEMARNKAIREAEKRLKGDLLTALLQDILSPRDARLWVQSMGLDLSQAHVALRFAWDGPSPPSGRRLETLVNGEISRMGLHAIVSPMEAEVICFCQVSREATRPETAIALGQAVLDEGRRENPNVQGRCGIGTPAEELEDWLNSLRQAGQALEMARRLGESKPLYYSDLSVYRLLMQLERSPELSTFQQETLGKLLASESANELIHTLEAYFENNGNLSKTAEALYVHRNTLIYRMGRIADITDMDLDNPESRLALQLALRIYRMTQR